MYEAYGKTIYKNDVVFTICFSENAACHLCCDLNEATGYGRCWHS